MDNANATAMATSPPEENRVDYRVHLPAPACSDRDAAEALLIEMRVHVRALLRAISHQRVSQGGRVDESDDGDAIVDDDGDDHLWQVDPFALSLRKSASQTSNASATVSAMASTTTDHWELRGSTRFGDCIEDEWLIVHLLLALTSAFAGVAVE